MQPLSERKHKALISALQQLHRLMEEDLGLSKLRNFGKGTDDIRQLEELYDRYQQLMAELGDCIGAYHDLYKDLKINVLAPQVRHIRHRMDQRSAEYHTLKTHLVAVRSY
ncbi:hypothetical protein G5B35_23205 [Parapusillimonas sp. SGNA-6]|uniref:hypothetical protein n=1 Tax=Parapedobacter sp. SGR-10 TaxID=2710879 RepID=UPI0013D085B5|nr:hypothetical protein [Parapedobacter sp. SGR-10]NGF55561.1 hypothetical protein [Parapedobacter sp. SGR-10]NGM90209.1 hypothetical protein [Parapusillimonas sp. SGNA-6]